MYKSWVIFCGYFCSKLLFSYFIWIFVNIFLASSLSHLNQNFVLFQILYHKWFINRKLLYLIPTSYQLRLALNFSYHAFIFISVFISCVVLMLNYRYISFWLFSDHSFIFLPTRTKLIKLSFSKANVVWVCLWQPL